MEFHNDIDFDSLVVRKRPRQEDHRGYFFRDITAIIHSYPFRRLKHKTQVFFSPKNDHICTRIEHVMHVATISATICKALGLDVDLVWAISLGHDFGHTPFGHVGERILSNILSDSGGFNHELYSLYVVDNLINYGKGLDLTYAVRDGILNHCGETFEQAMQPDFSIRELSAVDEIANLPCTWEGVIMRMSDKVAYLGRDLEDAMSLGLIQEEEIPLEVTEVLGRTNSAIIDTLVSDIIATAEARHEIGYSDPVYRASLVLKEFNYARIYENPRLEAFHAYFDRILNTLFDYLYGLYERYGYDLPPYLEAGNSLSSRFGDYLQKMRGYYDKIGELPKRIVGDYIAGMTDDFAIDSIQEIMVPRKFSIAFDDHLYDGHLDDSHTDEGAPIA